MIIDGLYILLSRQSYLIIMQKVILVLLILQSYALYQYCPPGYFFNVQHCQTCTANCICSSPNTCSSCVAGYTMYNGNCIQCPQSSGIYGACSGCCSRTNGTILSCTDCVVVPNYYSFLYSGRCILSPGCFQIDSNGFCLECLSGFFQTNNLCYACDTSCATCVDTTNCLTCANGYYWGVINGGLCTACPLGCSTCDSTGNCSTCLNNYYINQNHCLGCPSNCSTCIDGSTCVVCQYGILVSNLCVMCTDTTYGGSAGCTSCQQSNNFVVCNACADTYFLDSNNLCQSCSDYITGASRCRDKNTPTQCQNDYNSTLTNRYYLVGISCIANSKSCMQIADIYGNCSTCYNGYIITAGACVQCPFVGCVAANSIVVGNVCTCTLCGSGYYLPAASVVCSPCSTLNCATCPLNACTACLPNYYWNGASCAASTAANCLKSASLTTCAICNSGYYLGSNNLCYNCQQSCLTCTSRFICTTCNANQYLLNGTCIALPTNCVVFNPSTLQCTLCNYGSYLINGRCVQCTVELGTLSNCQGYCPIDYYIQNFVILTNGDGRLIALLLITLIMMIL